MEMKQKTIRYGKPCMTNLPPKLGRMIFNEILNAPPFDDSKLRAKNKRLISTLAKRIDAMNNESCKSIVANG